MQLLYMFPCNDADSSWSSWNNMKLPVPLCDSRMSSNLHVSTSFPFLTTWSLLPSDHQSSFSFIFPTVVFSSMTSLQKEEFFDLVATSQARRLDDQRAQLERSPPAKSKARSFRGSIKQLSFVRRPTATPASVPVPVPVPKEDLYNMILTTQVSKWIDVFFITIQVHGYFRQSFFPFILHPQAQGRLEDQRSRAPGPMDDEDFFSLLLRVQGGRMDEQRTELPCLLQTWEGKKNIKLLGYSGSHPVL